MTPKQTALSLINQHYDAIPLDGFSATYLKFREMSILSSLVSVQTQLFEHSREKLNGRRWEFWDSVRIELEKMKLKTVQ